MGFKLNVPNVRLRITEDALRGGLSSWGSGDLEVLVDGGISLEAFFDLIERLSGLPTSPEDFDPSQSQRMKAAFVDFGAMIKDWSIEDWSPRDYHKLPFPIAIAIFTAYAQAAKPDPTLPATSMNGATSRAAYAPMGLS